MPYVERCFLWKGVRSQQDMVEDSGFCDSPYIPYIYRGEEEGLRITMAEDEPNVSAFGMADCICQQFSSDERKIPDCIEIGAENIKLKNRSDIAMKFDCYDTRLLIKDLWRHMEKAEVGDDVDTLLTKVSDLALAVMELFIDCDIDFTNQTAINCFMWFSKYCSVSEIKDLWQNSLYVKYPEEVRSGLRKEFRHATGFSESDETLAWMGKLLQDSSYTDDGVAKAIDVIKDVGIDCTILRIFRTFVDFCKLGDVAGRTKFINSKAIGKTSMVGQKYHTSLESMTRDLIKTPDGSQTRTESYAMLNCDLCGNSKLNSHSRECKGTLARTFIAVDAIEMRCNNELQDEVCGLGDFFSVKKQIEITIPKTKGTHIEFSYSGDTATGVKSVLYLNGLIWNKNEKLSFVVCQRQKPVEFVLTEYFLDSGWTEHGIVALLPEETNECEINFDDLDDESESLCEPDGHTEDTSVMIEQKICEKLQSANPALLFTSDMDVLTERKNTFSLEPDNQIITLNDAPLMKSFFGQDPKTHLCMNCGARFGRQGSEYHKKISDCRLGRKLKAYSFKSLKGMRGFSFVEKTK